MGPILPGITRAAEHLEMDGQFDWPLDFPGKRGTYWLYDMPPPVQTVVLEVMRES